LNRVSENQDIGIAGNWGSRKNTECRTQKGEERREKGEKEGRRPGFVPINIIGTTPWSSLRPP